MDILLANPRGFCAGVNRAIQIVDRALELFGAPIYVRHEVVHNRHVVEDLRARGAIFVEELDEVPDAATVIFSAHGVPIAVREHAAARGLSVFDATCPLVTKVHMEVKKYSRDGMEMVLIGHAGHPEVEGTMGQVEEGMMYLVSNVSDVATLAPRNPDKLAYITQTTLSMDDTAEVIAALRSRFPLIEGPKKDDICYATQNRQDAVKSLAPDVDILLVVGAPNSSNSSRLAELGTRLGTRTHLIEDAQQLRREWFEGVGKIGISAGASAPESLVQEIMDTLRGWGARVPQEMPGVEEKVTFSLPLALIQAQTRREGA
ncbi:4-hydroxy-3-methylbut-2-enyl diphosphate reductase [Acidithiobacillus sp. 'AMD consortium']|jgi:4-hydroxy-3-methylbut-2-enyl diphosphate reductase|uniref:4-hydroxy-3-methylbut-2-enyl diphosphate reductase n=2 Tax=Acidithiobacillus ferridurans TaxID=1232575 RepID=A0A8X8G939_ACIFI|nr:MULTISPECIES: 4-hydroxy-3-methylbut-2-enyl diphosphate reductase [Acidithiobacillus]MDA8151793.1 4-hydroxy-3-methylbut-2-enyl diphosphate reductase [Acidithiobacillus sp.]MBU2716754.1 4-hydroxy-3-methylbut-2-enyl diphosphate reductase [Acidithiobacillus ferridurans]MBU2718529.1 4-hydroxy-3-methylbut-2-enyl diphosphate reductase [Acidithiobacillus ferridurans]MBU2724451.1 4-hydroxy-3-methylbut-2-enyl diphosphate reductase [Acidithiobacillus ferridurans]MBU2725235.1 4-hydroxy-3-methylbut-2-en